MIWFHEEMLSVDHPLFQQEGEKLFVWDDLYFKEREYSLKRLVFIYESLIELPLKIVKGETKKVLDKGTITQWSPNPWIQEVGTELEVQWIETQPFVDLDSHVYCKRFFGFWKKIEKMVL